MLAHRRLIDPRGLGLSEERPLPTIKEVDDPVLASIWDPPVRSAQIDRALGKLGHVVEAEGRRWVFVYRELRRLRAANPGWSASTSRSRKRPAISTG